MTSPSPRPASAPRRARRALHWILFTFFTLFGLGLATSPAWSGTRSSVTATIGWLLLGLAVLTVPLITWSRFLAQLAPNAPSALVETPDGEIAWADIVGVEVVSVRPQRPVIRLIARPDAVSLSRTWRRLLVHLDLKTDEAVLDIPLLALDDPGRVAAFLSILRGLPRDERLLQLEGAGQASLRGIQLDRRPGGG